MFWSKYKKKEILFIPIYTQFYSIEVGFEGVLGGLLSFNSARKSCSKHRILRLIKPLLNKKLARVTGIMTLVIFMVLASKCKHSLVNKKQVK